MAKSSLNFKTRPKHFLTVTLYDDTVLFIGTPTKAVFKALTTIQNNLEELDFDSPDSDVLDEIYECCAIAMSRNKTGKEITREYVEKTFDLEDIIVFFNAYVDFVNEIGNSKN